MMHLSPPELLPALRSRWAERAVRRQEADPGPGRAAEARTGQHGEGIPLRLDSGVQDSQDHQGDDARSGADQAAPVRHGGAGGGRCCSSQQAREEGGGPRAGGGGERGPKAQAGDVQGGEERAGRAVHGGGPAQNRGGEHQRPAQGYPET